MNDARETKVLDNLNRSLISLGQLCDDNCKVVLTKKKLYAYEDNKKVLEGNRITSGDGLWDISVKINPVHKLVSPTKSTTSKSYSSINIILRTDEKSTNLAMYHHGTVFLP